MFKLFAYFSTFIMISSCGTKSLDYNELPKKKKINDSKKIENAIPDQGYKIKGSWSAHLSHQESFSLNLNAQKSQFTIVPRSNVPINLKFKVSDLDFQVPSNPEDGLLSFGKFSIHQIRDNHLRACGDNENEKCNFAAIRIYTKGTPGEGYWNSEENYGLPITSGNEIIPFYEDGFLAVDIVDISGIRVLKSKHFSDAIKNIPIAVDFSDAAYGTYYTELVIDYIVY